MREKHEGCRPFACPKCPKRFWKEKTLKVHERIHLPIEEKLPCAHCDKLFKQEASLKTHVRQMHLNDRPFACSLCDKRFISKGALNEHQYSHSKERQFACSNPECEKSFKSRHNLKIHKQTHTDGGLSCSECGWKAPSKYALGIHIFKHSDEKNVSCEYCDKKFKRLKTLKVS